MTKTIEDSTAFAGDYSTALRALGCDLEVLGIEAFDLCCEGTNYVVRIESQKSKKPKIKEKARRILRRILPNHSSPIAPDGVLVYTPDDIKRLDHDGQLRRHEGGDLDPHSLSQALRAIGAYVWAKDGRLLRISKHGPFITIHYETALDGVHTEETEEFTPASLYDVFVPMYVKRSERLKDVNKRARQIGGGDSTL